jgi:mitochondrial cardiolipin hydrolase
MKKLTLTLAALLFCSMASANVDVVFTSANHGHRDRAVVADKIISVMQGAKNKIHIAVAHFNSERITNALINIHNAKNKNADPEDDLEILVMLDLGEYGDRKSKSQRLEAAGIKVRYKTYSIAFFHPHSQLMHHKYMLVDDTDLVTGSYNWSDTAEFSNYENILHYHKRNVKKVLAAFRSEFDKLWTMERDKYDAFVKSLSSKKGEDGYKRFIPVHFNNDYFKSPMSLTRSELKVVRSLAAKLGIFKDRSVRGNKYFDRESKTGTSVAPAGAFLPDNWEAVSGSTPATGGTSTDGATGALRDGDRNGNNADRDD